MQINRTSELARVFGIDFFSVLSRGSQYRVESMLVRLAHTQNYVLISPGHQQVFVTFYCLSMSLYNEFRTVIKQCVLLYLSLYDYWKKQEFKIFVKGLFCSSINS